MDRTAPIGVFDSGIGGLTVMRRLIHEMPYENMVYFGDTARVPYGNKSMDTILRYTRQIIRFLQTKDVKAIVIACNTASAYALHAVEKETDVPVIGVIHPGAQATAATTKNGQVGIIGTYATMNSLAYDEALRLINPNLRIFKQACPLFVPFAEEGITDELLTDLVIERYLSKLRSSGIDTLLLGCTHYPLLKSAIQRFMGDSVACVDPATNTAHLLQERLAERGLLRKFEQNDEPEYSFYVSDDAARTTEFANQIMPFSIEQIRKINIEDY